MYGTYRGYLFKSLIGWADIWRPSCSSRFSNPQWAAFLNDLFISSSTYWTALLSGLFIEAPPVCGHTRYTVQWARKGHTVGNLPLPTAGEKTHAKKIHNMIKYIKIHPGLMSFSCKRRWRVLMLNECKCFERSTLCPSLTQEWVTYL